MYSRRPKRVFGLSYTGFHRYSLTFCCRNRERCFTQPDVVRHLLLKIRHIAEQEHFALLAYCFMPDHLHLVIEGTQEGADLHRFVNLVKQSSGYWYSQQFGRTLWQRGYYEHIIRDEESTVRMLRYVLENPIRAGLANDTVTYPYAGSDVFPVTELYR